MLKAVVLGGQKGLLGQALTAALAASDKWSVTACAHGEFDYFSSGLHDDLSARIDALEPDCLFNAVAYTDVEGAEAREDHAMALNRRVPAVLAGIMKSRPTRLMHFSTDFVFDGRKNAPYTTDDEPHPLSAYGRSKLAGEYAILEAGISSYNIIRTAWLFGRGGKNFARNIFDRCRSVPELKVVFDQVGSPTYTTDLAQHCVTLANLGIDGLFHIVNSGQASWCELADEIVQCCQMECRIIPVTGAEWPSKVQRPAYSVLDTSRFSNLSGQIPRGWTQALREFLMRDFQHGS